MLNFFTKCRGQFTALTFDVANCIIKKHNYLHLLKLAVFNEVLFTYVQSGTILNNNSEKFAYTHAIFDTSVDFD